MACRRADCFVPDDVAHRHRPPSAAELAEAVHSIEVVHPPHCAWRRDVYQGCSCGVTGLVMQLEDAMRPNVRSE